MSAPRRCRSCAGCWTWWSPTAMPASPGAATLGRLRSQALPHLFVQAMMMHGDCVVNSDISLSRRVDARSPFPLRPRAASRPCPRRRTPRSSSRSWAPPTTTWSTTVCRSWSVGGRPWRASCATAPSTSHGARTDLVCPPCPRTGSSSSGRQVRHGVMRVCLPCMRAPHACMHECMQPKRIPCKDGARPCPPLAAICRVIECVMCAPHAWCIMHHGTLSSC